MRFSILKLDLFRGSRTSGSTDADRNYIVVGDAIANNAKNLGDIDTKDEVKSKKPTAFHYESFHDKTKTLQTKFILLP